MRNRALVLTCLAATVVSQLYFLVRSPNSFGEQASFPENPYQYEEFIRTNYADRLGLAGEIEHLIQDAPHAKVIVDTVVTDLPGNEAPDQWTQLLPILLPAFGDIGAIHVCAVPDSARSGLTNQSLVHRSEFVDFHSDLSTEASSIYLLARDSDTAHLTLVMVRPEDRWVEECGVGE